MYLDIEYYIVENVLKNRKVLAGLRTEIIEFNALNTLLKKITIGVENIIYDYDTRRYE